MIGIIALIIAAAAGSLVVVVVVVVWWWSIKLLWWEGLLELLSIICQNKDITLKTINDYLSSFPKDACSRALEVIAFLTINHVEIVNISRNLHINGEGTWLSQLCLIHWTHCLLNRWTIVQLSWGYDDDLSLLAWERPLKVGCGHAYRK